MDGRESMPGLSGMPRGIPDYPDAYAEWNALRSFGSSRSPSFFHRGVSGSGHASGTGYQEPPGFNPATNPIFSVQSLQTKTNVRENTSPSFPPGFNVRGGSSSGVPMGESVKKKRGRPRKYLPDHGTNMALGVSPLPSGSGSGSETPTPKRGRGRPRGSSVRKQKNLAPLGSFQEAEALQQPPPPPPPPPPATSPSPSQALGYSKEVPVDIPSEEEDPLFRLKPPPSTVGEHASMFVEKSNEIIEGVKSLLLSELLLLPNTEINTMISKANRSFTVLDNMDCYGGDYTSFYRMVRRFIRFKQEELVAENLRTRHCTVVEEVNKRRQEVVIEAKNAEEAMQSFETNLLKAKDNVACITQTLKEAIGDKTLGGHVGDGAGARYLEENPQLLEPYDMSH